LQIDKLLENNWLESTSTTRSYKFCIVLFLRRLSTFYPTLLYTNSVGIYVTVEKEIVRSA